MIHIIDDYYVDGGAKDFTLFKKTSGVNKEGEKVDRVKIIGYYSSVANAVESLRKLKCRELTSEKNMELHEAVNAFEQIAEELRQAMEELI